MDMMYHQFRVLPDHLDLLETVYKLIEEDPNRGLATRANIRAQIPSDQSMERRFSMYHDMLKGVLRQIILTQSGYFLDDLSMDAMTHRVFDEIVRGDRSTLNEFKLLNRVKEHV